MKISHLAVLIGSSVGGVIMVIVILQISHTAIQIEGLNDTYITGKPIDFIVKADGYGSICQGPQVSILDAENQSNVVWWGSSPAFSGPYCNAHQFEFAFHAGEHYAGIPLRTNRPIVINKTGDYIAKASLGDTNLEERFTVVPALSSKITLSDDEKQKLIDEALNITGIRDWSNQWQFSTMDFSGISNKTGTDWKYVFVMLHLSHDAKTSYPCDVGWNARIQIDLDTKKIVNALYPTMQDHECNGITLGPQDVKNVK